MLIEHFNKISDPRIERKKLYQLNEILFITICALISGAEGWEHIEEFGIAREDWFCKHLELKNGIPSHDTFRRVFSLIDPKEFQECFISWIESVREVFSSEVVSIDGKTLCGSHDKAKGKKAIHLVSAWAAENKLILGQVKTAEKSNEITAIPELLELLYLEGCIVTLDAMGCQKEIVKKIRNKSADYMIALKANQGNLNQEIREFFKIHEATDFVDLAHYSHEETNSAHGRIEIRNCIVTDQLDWLKQKYDWVDLKTVAMIQSTRIIGEKETNETRFYISSLPAKAELFNKVIRQHWGIENSVHWCLDVSLREDESRVREDKACENLATVRRIALNLLKQETTHKKGVKAKRLKAGWDLSYLEKVILG